jgi:endothelin-converting enzyme
MYQKPRLCCKIQTVSNGDTEQRPDTPFAAYIASLVHEPLTALTKALLILALILFLLSSIFIGLFAGAQHRLNLKKKRQDGIPIQTTTVTETATSVFPTTSVYTTTSVSTTTSYSTTTSVSTTTVIPPPLPTETPEEVTTRLSHCRINYLRYAMIECVSVSAVHCSVCRYPFFP